MTDHVTTVNHQDETALKKSHEIQGWSSWTAFRVRGRNDHSARRWENFAGFWCTSDLDHSLKELSKVIRVLKKLYYEEILKEVGLFGTVWPKKANTLYEANTGKQNNYLKEI